MTTAAKSRDLIQGYLNGTLTESEQASLQSLLVSNPAIADEFALACEQDALLDEHFSEAVATRVQADELLKSAEEFTIDVNRGQTAVVINRRRSAGSRYWSFAAVVALGVAVLIVMFKGTGGTPASAAAVELKRVIAASAELLDRTYQITVEGNETITRPPPRPPRHDRKGPPPPPPSLKDAQLHVRGGRQFVLVRKTPDGRPFITGSNGKMSWLVLPDGPVRVSSDPSRFSRGVPGYQHAIPLINIEEGLQGLFSHYDIELEPLDASKDEESFRLLTATKKSPKHPGPRRVEITFAVRSGLIEQMRFIDLPRPREAPTSLLLTLVAQEQLGPDFFDHTSHHEPGRPVKTEE